MNQYQAYSDENPGSISNLALDIATAPIRPSTYAWMYTHVPGMWSGTQGVKIPFNITRSKSALSTAGKMFGEKRFVSGMAQGIKGTIGSFAPFGGDRVFNFGEQLGRTNELIGKYEGFLNTTQRNIASKKARISEIWNTRRTRQRFAADALTRRAANFYMNPDDLRDVVKGIPARNRYKPQSKRWIASHRKSLRALEEKATNYQTKLFGLTSKRTGLVAGKWALRGGKAIAGIGAVAFAWDVSKMIGQPLGRAIVSEYENVMNQFDNRFMPELGGRLEMSYLSQGAATERQRALEAMSKAQITGRSAFGQEAKYAHY